MSRTIDVRLLTGGEAVAHAMRQIDPDVVPVYPITPQTPIIQTFAKFVADGAAQTEIVNVESEHSAMSAAIGAALAGARTMTATSSQGLALMAEVVYIAASMRAPIVMALGNRALSGPINIHCDHSDSMLIRDSGVDPALRRERAGGVRPDRDRAAARRASGRAAAGARLPGRLHDHALGRAGRRCLPDAVVRRFVGDYRIPNPVLDVAAPDHAGAVRDARLLLRVPPPAGRRDREPRRRVLAELAAEFEPPRRPSLRRDRGVPARRRLDARSSRSARRPEP